ncbi:CRISPR-associated helicase, Cas3 family [Roseivivax sediminis]|uniref:CRISPR-associated helicase, Cas3 family n=1 Tax=Roseivivax sediminis TaxID=936889 RepID=A0A1I2EGE4_9RHOB|nr:CRISPR-associated helicase, Cas3 family [Roseivivax sediminis]
MDAFDIFENYDWRESDSVLGEALLAWFPEIRTAAPPPVTNEFSHYVAGLIALADWIGSDRNAFRFVPEFDPEYWPQALEIARLRLGDIGLDAREKRLKGSAVWPLISDHSEPRPAQKAVAEVANSERLIILEAETGSGKTEAALWRFARLFEAGDVEGLYFAVPTRAAARQLQQRVHHAARRLFRDAAPEAVLAVPGQVLAGEASGQRLPDFETRWDDAGETAPSRWAAEHATRFLAAQIAVGTVDQAMMAGLKVKHAHLRGVALSRSLLVIDEVHASDAWMTEIQRGVVRDHLALGGHAMLMSATLGASARAVWRDEPTPPLLESQTAPYPAVWTLQDCRSVAHDAYADKTVKIAAQLGWDGASAAGIAVQAAKKGACVLVVRNTVDRAKETWAACIEAASDLVFALNGVPTLHHSRFAAEDRARLDARVEQVFKDRDWNGGCILVGTQTLEQSLDIDADMLVTDLCPMDVLLQRIGRLHRHADRVRPDGFETAAAHILCPPAGLDPLTRQAENGLGVYAGRGTLTGVYLDVAMLAATLDEIERAPVWRIPEMNRGLVERATHPERLDAIAAEFGWTQHRRDLYGKVLAEIGAAELQHLDRRKQFPCSFPADEIVYTRLGAPGALLRLDVPATGPFGHPVRSFALPARWSDGIDRDAAVSVVQTNPLVLEVAGLRFVYDSSGLRKQ